MSPFFLTAVMLFASAGSPPPSRIPAIGADFRPTFQKGVCFTHNHSIERGYGSEMAAKSFAELRQLGVTAVSISPLGYSFNLQDPRIFGYEGEDLTMTPDRIRQTIRDAHAAGLQVTLTPQIWVGMFGARGDWRGDVKMPNDRAWREWFANYTRFIVYYAQLAEEEGVELFVVGSEMRTATADRPDDWREVIKQVRGTYRGPCTYAANWAEELDLITFWDLLEYIGVSAYFPIGTGTLDERLAEAAKTRDHLAALSAQFSKPILFLEAGFRPVDGAGEQPHAWRDGQNAAPNFEEQRLGYETYLRTYWNQPWFYGFYWWQWFSDLEYRPDPPTDFQFRGNPAESLLRDFYSRPNPRQP